MKLNSERAEYYFKKWPKINGKLKKVNKSEWDFQMRFYILDHCEVSNMAIFDVVFTSICHTLSKYGNEETVAWCKMGWNGL